LHEWNRLQNTKRPQLKQLLLQNDVRTEQLVPLRAPAQRRKTSSLT
jgi:hypothetical protein